MHVIVRKDEMKMNSAIWKWKKEYMKKSKTKKGRRRIIVLSFSMVN